MIVGEGKPWAYDPEWLNREACEMTRLVPLLIALGCDTPAGVMPLPYYWWSLPVGIQRRRQAHHLAGQDTVLWLRSRPKSDHLLMVHQPTGQWWDFHTEECGHDLSNLVMVRLNLTPGKAAWRLAKLLGFKAPLPPTAVPE